MTSNLDYHHLASQLEDIAGGKFQTALDDDSRIRLLEAMRRAIPELEKPSEAAQRVPYTPFEIMGAKIGYDLGLFKLFADSDGPKSTVAVAEATGAEEALLTRLLKFLSSMSMISEVDRGLWGPSNFTRTFTDPTIAAGLPHHTDNLGTAILALPEFLRKNGYKSPAGATDAPFASVHPNADHIFDWFGANPENLRSFMLWMGAHRLRERQWLDVFPFQDIVLKDVQADGPPVFVDVGGGIGHQCKAVLDKYPQLHGRVVLEDEVPTLAGALEIDGMESVVVDFFKAQPIKGARVYYLRSILHDWKDERCQAILSILRDAMGPESMIVIDDHVVPETKAHKTVMQMDMTMLLALGAEERTERKWQGLIESVGLRMDGVFCYDERGGDSILVVRLKQSSCP